MPSGPHFAAVPTWTIRSVAVCTRDGPERLDQAYRRLLNDASADRPPVSSDSSSGAAVFGSLPDSRR
jgi:hypothetical protein